MNRKTLKFSLLISIVFLTVFVLSGCTKKSEEVKSQPDNTASEIQDKLAEQQAKIDELQKFKDEQQQANDEINTSQKIATCQKRKEDCQKKIYELENGELNIYRQGKLLKGSRTEMINQFEKDISGWEKNKNDSNVDESLKKRFEDNINNAKKEIKKIKDIMASEATARSDLLAGECKDYTKPCE